MIDEKMFADTYDKDTGFLKMYIEDLSVKELKEKCTSEGLPMDVKSNIHLDLRWYAPLEQKAGSGIFRFDTTLKQTKQTCSDQFVRSDQAWDFVSPSMLIQAGITYYQKTGRFLLKGKWSRTSHAMQLNFTAPGHHPESLTCHARVGFVEGIRGQRPHYFVDYLFNDQEVSPDVGVILGQRVKK